MAYTPGDKYVTPTGIGLFDRIFGGRTQGGPYDPDLGSRGINPGTMFGPDPFAAPSQAWARMMFGQGVAPQTPQLNWASQGSTNRFFGDGTIDPASGLPNGGWADRWNQWFGTDVEGPDGNVLLSPLHQTGLRVGQDYGVNRDAQGNVADPWHSEMFQSALGIRNNLNQDPWLHPENVSAGIRALNASSPYARPERGDYLSTMQQATGGPDAADFYGQRGIGQMQGVVGGTDFDLYGRQGEQALRGLNDDTDFDQFGRRNMGRVRRLNERTDFDQYGQRGVDQTNALASANIDSLNRGIDKEAQRTLAFKLPEISQAMEAAGLGRSGAGQLQLQQALNDVLGQANRDKQRTMADYGDREANRQAQAINLGTQQGFAGQGQKYGSMINALDRLTQQGFAGASQEYGALANMIGQRAQLGQQGMLQGMNALGGAINQGSQIGASGYGQYAGQMGQAALAGLGDEFAMNQAYRQNEQGLFSQSMQNRFAKNQGDQNALFQMLGQAGQFGLGQLDAERMGQSAALQDYMNLVNNREGYRSSGLNEMLGLSDRQRSIQQDILNQQMQAGFMPLDLITRLTTGISGSNYQGTSSAPWWAGALGGVASGVGQGIGDGAGSWLQAQFGNP